MTADQLATDDLAPPVTRPSREYRARIAFAALAVWLTVGLVLFSGALVLGPPIAQLVLLFGPLLALAVMLIEVAGLGGRRPWAIRALDPMLWILVISGAVTFVLAILSGGIDLPIGALLAIWAFRAPATHDARSTGSGRRAELLLVAMLVLATVWPWGALLAVRPGGPFVAEAEDLVITVAVSGGCLGDGTRPVGAPETMTVTVDWTWQRTEAMPSGSDRLAITWFTMSNRGRTDYFLRQPNPDQGPGITLADLIAGQESGVAYAVDLGTRGSAPGRLSLTLERPAPPPGPSGTTVVEARYLHRPGAAWNSEVFWTKDVDGRCDWAGG